MKSKYDKMIFVSIAEHFLPDPQKILGGLHKRRNIGAVSTECSHHVGILIISIPELDVI